MTLRDRIFGDPKSMAAMQLRRSFAKGSPQMQIRVAREWLSRGEHSELLPLIGHTVPGVRLTAVRCLTWILDDSIKALFLRQLANEPSDIVRIAIGQGLRRVGTKLCDILPAIAIGPATIIATESGERDANKAIGLHRGVVEEHVERSREAYAHPNRSAAIAAAQRWLTAHDANYGELSGWALLAIPGFIENARRRLGDSERKAQQLLLSVFGAHGEPAHLNSIRSALDSFSHDPGMGFALRRSAAFAIAQIGDPSAFSMLHDAALREVRDFEGRPGSGLGIQYPVRNTIIWAMGELGNVDATPYLLSLLDSTESTATGGLYLPAMSALVKLGPRAQQRVKRWSPPSPLAATHFDWVQSMWQAGLNHA